MDEPGDAVQWLLAVDDVVVEAERKAQAKNAAAGPA